MFGLVIELELQRRAVIRQVSRMFYGDGDRYFGIALVVLGISLMLPGVAIAVPTLPFVAIGLAVIGLVCICTIVLAPIGLVVL